MSIWKFLSVNYLCWVSHSSCKCKKLWKFWLTAIHSPTHANSAFVIVFLSFILYVTLSTLFGVQISQSAIAIIIVAEPSSDAALLWWPHLALGSHAYHQGRKPARTYTDIFQAVYSPTKWVVEGEVSCVGEDVSVSSSDYTLAMSCGFVGLVVAVAIHINAHRNFLLLFSVIFEICILSVAVKSSSNSNFSARHDVLTVVSYTSAHTHTSLWPLWKCVWRRRAFFTSLFLLILLLVGS